MTHLKQGYFATVHTFGKAVGHREISDPGADCSGLAEAVALSLALLWSSDGTSLMAPPPNANAGESEAAPEPALESGAEAEPVRKSEPAPAPPAKKSRKPVPRRAPKSAHTSYGLEVLLGAAVGILEHP